jgi:DNA-binding Xre family transcriptional regulator
MAISYKKLWKLLIDRDLKKKDLRQMAGVEIGRASGRERV